MYDTIVATLRCPHCGKIVDPGDPVNMQTRLRDKPDGSYYQVNDLLPIDHGGMADSGYLVVQRPSEPVRICQLWSCPHCGHYPNWAEVVVRDGHIVSIEGVRLDRGTLDRIHYLDEDARYFIADRAGVEFEDLPRNEVMDALRQYLENVPELA